MKFVFSLTLIALIHVGFSQTTIIMERRNGVHYIPCKVNGLPLEFVFDTGAGDVTISLTEALFMYKQGYLKEPDFRGTEFYKIANGEIVEGTRILIKELEFAGLKLFNIEASVVHTLNAPLLLGQSAISKLGKIQLDLTNNLLIVFDGNLNKYDFSKSSKEISGFTATSILPKIHSDNSHLDPPCLEKSGKVKYKTNIILGTVMRDKPNDIQGKRVKKLNTGEIVKVIDDKNYGGYVFASVDDCYGFVAKSALRKFEKKTSKSLVN